jgi:hypothetical protein
LPDTVVVNNADVTASVLTPTLVDVLAAAQAFLAAMNGQIALAADYASQAALSAAAAADASAHLAIGPPSSSVLGGVYSGTANIGQVCIGIASDGHLQFASVPPNWPHITVNDVNYSMVSGAGIIAYTALTTPREVDLVAAGSVVSGTTVTVVDESGDCSITNYIQVNALGTDTIAGLPSIRLTNAYAAVQFISNGVDLWISTL